MHKKVSCSLTQCNFCLTESVVSAYIRRNIYLFYLFVHIITKVIRFKMWFGVCKKNTNGKQL